MVIPCLTILRGENRPPFKRASGVLERGMYAIGFQLRMATNDSSLALCLKISGSLPVTSPIRYKLPSMGDKSVSVLLGRDTAIYKQLIVAISAFSTAHHGLYARNG